MTRTTSKALLGLAISMGMLQVHAAASKKVDALLIGRGIMSATLGVWLNELEPGWTMEKVERLLIRHALHVWHLMSLSHSRGRGRRRPLILIGCPPTRQETI
jgi:malate dehydrogenase (quinone)